MVYVFVFLGEFGYELLNWQGVIRKFAGTIGSADRIICCSRAGLDPLYEMADEYLAISSVPLFQQSRASCYHAIYTPAALGRAQIGSYGVAKWLQLRLRTYGLQMWLPIQLQRYIVANSKLLRELKVGWWLRQGLLRDDSNCCTFIFSSPSSTLHDCTFGGAKAGRDIYERLDLGNNLYRKIEADLSARTAIEAQLGWSLAEPFVLLQDRKRDASTKQPSADTIPQAQLLKALGRRIKTVLLSFDTGRWLDSYSSFANDPNCYHYACRSFREQSCLIHYARHCLFLTEGDFGSHIYVPPFLGKDVIAIAPRSVYAIGNTPIDFWNRHVFQFGGQIVSKIAEEVFATAETIDALLDEMLVQPASLPMVAA